MSTNDFIEVKREDFAKYANNLQAGHCMIYARLPSMQFEGCDLRAAVLVRTIYYRNAFLTGPSSSYSAQSGLILDHDNKIFFIFFQMQMRFDGHIGFPGGLIEPGEEVVHGLIREMHEEINLDPESNQVTSIKI